MSATRTVLISDPLGLHARPAADFVAQARSYASDVSLTAGEKHGNCKSLLSILKLGITQGTEVALTASGPDEQTAVDELCSLLVGDHDATAPS